MSFWSFIVAFLTSLLAAMGVGGGGFLVIYLTLVLGMEQLMAQGVNLFFFLAGALPSLVIHLFKRKINFPSVMIFSLFGVLGTFFGAYILSVLSVDIVRKAFGAMLAVSGVISLFKKKEK